MITHEVTRNDYFMSMVQRMEVTHDGVCMSRIGASRIGIDLSVAALSKVVISFFPEK